MKLGKLPRRFDTRTILLKDIILRVGIPTIPDTYDADSAYKFPITEQMLGNDTWGDCVMVGRANQEWRFQAFQQGKQIPITVNDVLNEYWSEEDNSNSCFGKFLSLIGKHPDNGLDMLTSLTEWRNKGWVVGGELYSIYAFAAIDRTNYQEVRESIFLFNGIQAGIQLPQSAKDQFNSGQIWDVTIDAANIVGGHCVYVAGYNSTGPICITWSRKQQLTWNFWITYCDEVYAVIDNPDKFLSSSPLNVDLLNQYLEQITGVINVERQAKIMSTM